jgi:hypothetical protein
LLLAVAAVNVALADPPAQSGMIVARGQDNFIAHYSDPSRGLLVTLGGDVIEFCAHGLLTFDLIEVQNIDVPEDANRLIQIFSADEMVIDVWPFTGFDCRAILSTDPLASGTVAITGTDNDLEVYNNPDNVNWNAFGFTARGEVTTADGDSARLNTVHRCVWDGVDGASGQCLYQINLSN